MKNDAITVSEFTALVNQTLSFAYPEIVVEGEVSSFKVNQQKWVFFDLKDEGSIVGCFIPIFQLKTAIEDGMLIRVKAVPQLTKWGKFSLTVREIELAGEGSVKRAFEMLKQKFEKEGLFDPVRKRSLPEFPQRVLLITSKQAAAYNDFMTVLNDRFKGLNVDHYQVQVQGEGAHSQIVKAIEYGNKHKEDYDVMIIIRGGGSLEDLQAFNNEEVVRAVYGSSIPSIVGIGHEDDVSLAELASDVRAATPTDAARRLVPDSKEVLIKIAGSKQQMISSLSALLSEQKTLLHRFYQGFDMKLGSVRHNLAETMRISTRAIATLLDQQGSILRGYQKLLSSLDPTAVLARGYSIARIDGKILKSSQDFNPSDMVVLQLHQGELSLVADNSERGKNRNGQTEINF
jgi:exodeoxyribonuclease VII large subunit